MAKKIDSYKISVEEIENIIEKIENGKPDVDELSELIKRGASLIKACKQKLKTTEDNLSQTLEDLE